MCCFYSFIQCHPCQYSFWKHSLQSEGLTLRVLRGADGAVAVQSHGVVVKWGDVRLAARQPGGHVAGATVCADTVVTVDVGGVWYRSLRGAHTHT